MAIPVFDKFKEELSRDIPVEIILKMVGYRDLGRAGREVFETTEQLITEAVSTASPVVLYRQTEMTLTDDCILLSTGGELHSSRLAERLEGCDGLVMAVMTMGRDMQQEIEQRLKEDIFNGYIFDTIASYLVERVSEIFWRWLKDEYRQQGIKTTSFVSPGSEAFPLENQQAIFDFLNPGQLGLSLSRTFLIEPTKSLSVVMGYGIGMEAASESHNCQDCEMVECLLRGIHSEL